MYRVILVDDEPWVLHGLASLIKKVNPQFQVVGSYESPIEAIEKAQSERPNVIFTDIRMQEMSGIDLIRTLRQRDADIEAVIVSAHKSFEVARDALDLNVRQYLLKPFNKNELQKVLERIVIYLDKKQELLHEHHLATLDQAAAFPFCCVLCTMDIGYTPPNDPGLLMTSHQVAGVPKAYLCSFEQKNLYKKLLGADGAAAGISTLRSDFSDIDNMCEEAVMSLHGRFLFSNNPQVSDVQRYLYNMSSQKVHAKGVADHFYLSHGYLCSLFKRETGTTMVSFFHHTRIYRAAHLLAVSDKSLVKIAQDLGYSDYNYFSRMFKRIHGISPELHRKMVRRLCKEACANRDVN